MFQLEKATAAFTLQKEGLIAHLIHDFKYKGNLQSGIILAPYLTYSLQESLFFKKIEGIIPVPLHPSRDKKEGSIKRKS